eukprot:GEMP01086069.1.p1 GENE.GEMP01086069.1~~GEMP01086069.1.p1  ORF type:complete len:219 (+),score=30.35 GEMP01086069.1:195-851(+)
MQLALDNDATYWIGGGAKWVFALPIIYIVAHVVFLRSAKIPRYWVSAVIVLPCLGFIITGVYYMTDARYVAQGLRYCNANTELHGLRKAYRVAELAYDKCRGRLGRDPRSIEGCPEYSGIPKIHSHQLRYLEYSERQHYCSSYCLEPSHSLWTSLPAPPTPCDISVHSKIESLSTGALQLTVYGSVMLFMYAPFYMFISPFIRYMNGVAPLLSERAPV